MEWLKTCASVCLRGIVVGLVVVLLASFGLLDGVERWGLTLLFHLRGPLPPQAPIVIVSVDEDSFDELDLPWPWPRALHGQFLDLVSQGRPAVVGLDILFPEPSSRGHEDDVALAEAVSRAGNVILAAARTVVKDPLYTKTDLNPPIQPIRNGAAGIGVVNIDVDNDASVRTANLKSPSQDTGLPDFDLTVYRTAVKVGLDARPFDGSSFYINYRGGPKTFPTIPFYKVLSGEVGPEAFTGKIVLVGSTSPALHDTYPTPFAIHGEMPGVEIHANVLETIFQGIPLKRVPRGTGFSLVLLAGILAVWIAHRFSPLASLGLVLMFAIAYAVVGFAGFVWSLVIPDVAPVPLALGLGYGVTVVENFIEEQRKRVFLMQLFSRHVSKEVADAIWQQRDQFRHGGRLSSQKLIATVLFTDLKGFTSVAERMDTQALMDWINAYFEIMARLVMEHGGVVDDYYGDAIKANFGVPFARTSETEIRRNAVNAVACALAMEKELVRLNRQWQEHQLPTVGMRIGIFTGEVVAGCLGSAERLKYTTIGDTVNTAARLESFEKDLVDPVSQSPCRILIGESTLRYVENQFEMQAFGELSLKGKEQRILVYRVFSQKERRKSVAMKENRRSADRIEVDTVINFFDDELTLNVAIADLSKGGMSVRNLSTEWAVGKIVRPRFGLPGFPHSIEVTGKVAWSRRDRTGIQFIDIKPVDQAVIEELVATHSSAAEAPLV
jgi:adenylate cyclase